MLKNLTILKLPATWQPSIADLEQQLRAHQFVPCGATQSKSIGFVPPRQVENGALVESIDGHRMVRLLVETKTVPGATVRREVDKRAALIEAETGRTPGRKERRTLQDDALLALLPQAFARQKGVLIWIDHANARLVLDTASQSMMDEAVSALIKACNGLSISLLPTNQSPKTAMRRWLATHVDELPDWLYLGSEGVLESFGEEHARIRYTRYSLEHKDVFEHLKKGFIPMQVAANWNGQVAFVLTDTLRVKRVQLLAVDTLSRDSEPGEDRFDADVALTTGMLAPMLNDLLIELGGLLEKGCSE